MSGTKPGFRLIPVMDIANGSVVRAYRGRRQEYRPWLDSVWCPSADPRQWACAIARQLPGSTVYVADLDALSGRALQWPVIESVLDYGLELWLDCGLRSYQDLCQVADRLQHHTTSAWRLVIGLETWQLPQQLETAVAQWGAQRLVFSLDLYRGRPMSGTAWAADPLEIIWQVAEAGFDHAILLELDNVGTESGNWAQELTAAIHSVKPDISLFPGGGVRNDSDLRQLQTWGCAGALVATALHTGRLGPLEWLVPRWITEASSQALRTASDPTRIRNTAAQDAHTLWKKGG